MFTWPMLTLMLAIRNDPKAVVIKERSKHPAHL